MNHIVKVESKKIGVKVNFFNKGNWKKGTKGYTGNKINVKTL